MRKGPAMTSAHSHTCTDPTRPEAIRARVRHAKCRDGCVWVRPPLPDPIDPTRQLTRQTVDCGRITYLLEYCRNCGTARLCSLAQEGVLNG